MNGAAQVAPAPGSTRLNALIVEDSQVDAELIVRELTRQGYGVEWRRVDTPGGMRSALAERTWDIVLSDHAMPGFSSAAAFEMLRASGSDVPFIIITGTLGEEAAVAAMRSGVHDLVLKDSLGRLGSAVARTIREAGERRRRTEAEAALRESRALLHSIVEGTTDVIFVKDLRGRYVSFNSAGARAVGKSVADVLGKDDTFLFPPADAARVMGQAATSTSMTGWT